MKRTTLFLDESIDGDLKALARRQGRPVAGLVREAIAEYVVAQKKRAGRVRLRFLAQGRSGHRDTAERHEELLWAEPHPAPPAGKRPRGRGRQAGRGKA